MKIQEGIVTSRMDLLSSKVTCEVKLRGPALAATAAVVEVKYKYWEIIARSPEFTATGAV